MDYLVDTVLTWGVVAIIIVFQPEIRGLLEKIGRTKLEIKHDNLSDDEKERLMDELVAAITKLSEDQTGAHIFKIRISRTPLNNCMVRIFCLIIETKTYITYQTKIKSIIVLTTLKIKLYYVIKQKSYKWY